MRRHEHDSPGKTAVKSYIANMDNEDGHTNGAGDTNQV
jgi:hypothetical protein